ncbi:hypothetical protein ACPPVT_14000 [Angustibacter sp. McL0619]|uniref:hypothetical protein n=1 Tax=Angustibacter sp. McL0619 TaxID=3415676 RepID=UPI003CF7C16B
MAQPSGQALDPACPRCGRRNPPELRFCAKCGQVLQGPATTALPRSGVSTATRTTWWQRLTGRTGGPDRTSVRAYRHSLSMRSRSLRVVVALLVAVGLGGALVVVRRSPTTLLRHLKNDLTNTQELVPVTALSVPTSGGKPKAAPTAVDDNTATPWTTTWRGGTDRVPTQKCAPITEGAAAHLVLTLDTARTVRTLKFVGGVPNDALRAQQLTPAVLQVTLADGSCQRLEVTSDGKVHKLKLANPVETSTITVEIAGAHAPVSNGSVRGKPISISLIQLFSRPL